MHDFEFDYDGIPPGYYDRVARAGSGVQRHWHRLKFKFLIDEIARLPAARRPPLHVLDLGCGPGTFLGMLSKQLDVMAVGVDLSQPQIEYAQATYGNERMRFIAAPIHEPTAIAEVNKADVVTIVEVIEHLHLKYVHQVFAELFRHMQPGAVLLVTTPNYLSLWPLLERAISFVSVVNYEEKHVLHFNSLKLRNTLATCGFSAIEVRTFLHASPFVAGLLGEPVARLVEAVERRSSRGGPLLLAKAVRE